MITKTRRLLSDLYKRYTEAKQALKFMEGQYYDLSQSVQNDLNFYHHIAMNHSGHGNQFSSQIISSAMGADAGFYSENLGFGTNEDKRLMFNFLAPARQPLHVLDGLMRNGLIKKMISLHSKEALRKPLVYDSSSDSVKDFINDDNGLNLDCKDKIGNIWGRGFGGAATILNINDGRESWEPVDVNRIRGIEAPFVVDCGFLSPLDYNNGLIEPQLYRVNHHEANVTIHVDRLLVYNGLNAGVRNRMSRGGWLESFIDFIFHAFMDFNVDHHAVSTIIKDFNQKIYTLSDFNSRASTDEAVSILKQKIATMKKMLSIINGVVMSDKDDLKTIQNPVTGLAELIEKVIKPHLCYVSDIPHVLLFNEQSGGVLGDAGGSQMRIWYDSVTDFQNDNIAPNRRKIIRYLDAMFGTTTTFTFPPLWLPSPKEQAEIDQIYVNMKAKSPREVAKEQGFNYSLVEQDEKQRNDSELSRMESELKLAQEQNKNNPEENDNIEEENQEGDQE